MLYSIALVIVVLWVLGLTTSAALGGYVHILLFLAVVIILIGIIRGRKQR